MRRHPRRPRLATPLEQGDGSPRRTLLWEPCVAAGLILLSGWLAGEMRRDAGRLATSTARASSELETLAALHRAVHARTAPARDVAFGAEAVVPEGEAVPAGRSLTVDLYRGCAALVLQAESLSAAAPR